MEELVQKNLAGFISGCDCSKIPGKVVEDAKLRILDLVGCAIAGANYPQMKICKSYFDEQSEKGCCFVFGSKKKYTARTAAFLNGVAGHVCELDDGHRAAIGHPASVTVPVALALAEQYGQSGADVLKAVILGYDTFIRMATCVNPAHYKTWHTTGTCGTLAAAVTASSLLGLSASQVNNALGIAATSAGGLIESFGTHAKALNIALACQNGVDAAELGRRGFTGAGSALLGKKGFIAAMCPGVAKIGRLEGVSEETLTSNTGFFKVYASCGHTNSPLDLVFRFRKEKMPEAKDIQSIEIRTYKTAVELTGALKCATEDEAKFSLPYCTALALLYGRVSLPLFAKSFLSDPEILALAAKVKVSESAEATAHFPKREAELLVTMKDGAIFKYEAENASDEISTQIVTDKFKAATESLSKEEQDRIISFILDLDQKKDVSGLVEIFGSLKA